MGFKGLGGRTCYQLWGMNYNWIYMGNEMETGVVHGIHK